MNYFCDKNGVKVIEEQKLEEMYFACCPHCKHVLMQGNAAELSIL